MTKRPNYRWIPRYWAVLYCVAIIGVVALALITQPGRPPEPATGNLPRWAALVTPAEARSQLTGLEATEPAPEVAYDRTHDFGPAWADVDHNGCDTRNDILRRDLDGVTYRPATGQCIVVTGSMVEPYTGTVMHFTKSDASAIQIDHLIPLHAAWILGAWRWTPEQRLAFANDPRNLVAVDGPANQNKSDLLADRWRPENPRIHCVYAINTVAVHATYQLAVSQPERHALEAMLKRCA